MKLQVPILSPVLLVGFSGFLLWSLVNGNRNGTTELTGNSGHFRKFYNDPKFRAELQRAISEQEFQKYQNSGV
jgi:hypothetical protein